MKGRVQTFTLLIARDWMWNSNKCDDFWTIKLVVFAISLNSEGKSMRSDQYLKSSGWTRSLSTLFASFHFIHSQLFVGGFLSNKISLKHFCSGLFLFLHTKNTYSKKIHGVLVFRRKKYCFHWCYLSSMKLNKTSVLKLGEVWTQKF